MLKKPVSIKPTIKGVRDPFQGLDPTLEPCQIVVFGVSGDLSRRKLMPALYALRSEGRLHTETTVVGVARKDWDKAAFRDLMRESVQEHSRLQFDAGVWESLESRMEYVKGSFEDPAVYESLKTCCSSVEHRGGPPSRLYYMATPPRYFDVIAGQLAKAGLVQSADSPSWTRLIVEKPFGRDRESAQALNHSLHQSFREEQIFRIDHYLGKETVQNLLVFRLGNGFVEPLLNRRFVDHVQITVAESVGVGSRAGYYDQAGVARDMFQSHMLQLLTLMCMEPPVCFEAKEVRDEKVKVLRAIKPWVPEDSGNSVIRGQYAAGEIRGQLVKGYLDEARVAANSTTDTFLAARVFVDTWRWSGTPFYLRSGKRLAERVTEISIIFRRPPVALFMEEGDWTPPPNVLTLRIQPDEGITLSFVAKHPGQHVDLERVRMDFSYSESFFQEPAEAYERLLLDAINGDSTLFTREDEVDLAWRVFDEWVAVSGDTAPKPSLYAAGTWGPQEADELIRRDGRFWVNPPGLESEDQE